MTSQPVTWGFSVIAAGQSIFHQLHISQLWLPGGLFNFEL